MCILVGVHQPVVPSWTLLACAGIGAIYLGLGFLYWFRVPIAGIAVATACLLIAWLLRNGA